jgi:hypothetical protein
MQKFVKKGILPYLPAVKMRTLIVELEREP